MTLRSITTGAVAAAMIVGAAAPAAAQRYYPGSSYGNRTYGYDYDRYRRRDNTGAVIAGVAAIGVIAAIAASSSSRRGYNNGYNGDIRNERQAARVCAQAASSRFGRVQGIDEVFRTQNGFRVRGTVEAGGYGNGYGRGYGERFACTIRYGQIANLRLAGGGRGGYNY